MPPAQWIAVSLIAVNIVTYLLFWYDKRCARKGHWRVAEAALLLGALLGGNPAAYLAMRLLRHKTRKTGFRVRYWLIVTVQAAALIFALTHPAVVNSYWPGATNG